VIEAHPRDVHLLDEVEDMGDLLDVEAIDGKAQTDLDAGGLAVADAVQSGAEGPGHGSEAVVHLLHSVQADSHVGQPDLFQSLGDGRGDQGAVGGDDGTHALGDGIGGELRQVPARQRLASGKEHHRNAECSQIVEQDTTLFGGELVRADLLFGVGVAMHAAQVAATGDVPNDHRFLICRKLQEMGRQLGRVASVAQGIGRLDRAAV
jgi:hypothetical protein